MPWGYKLCIGGLTLVMNMMMKGSRKRKIDMKATIQYSIEADEARKMR